MPRRKQGQAKETTGGNQKKKSDIGTKFKHNEAPKPLPNKNDLVFKIKKTLSSTTFSSTLNGKAQREHIASAKSLNENIVVSQPEVNNNSIKPTAMQKSIMISKSENLNYLVNAKNTNKFMKSSNDDTNAGMDNSPITTSPVKVDIVTCLSPVVENSPSDVNIKVKDIKKRGTNMAYQNSVITFSKEPVTDQLLNPVTIYNATVKSAQVNCSELIDSKHNQEKNESETDVLTESGMEKSDVDRGAQMSGVSPASPDVGSHSESHKCNYRLSTSITVTKSSPLNSAILKDGQNCELPSSVYGTPASSIEKVLNGLQRSEKINNSILEDNGGKISFLQTILEKDASEKISYHAEQEQKEKSNFLSKDKTSPELNKVALVLKDDNMKNNSNNSDSNRDFNLDNVMQPKLKLHIAEVLGTDDSSSSLFLAESQKVIKFPKITSPQILEQHISKIISENAAIIDTFDPLWPKRYLKNSISQNLDFDPKKQATIIKSINSNTLDNNNQSKLHSASLAGSEKELQNSSQSIIVTSNSNSSSFSKLRPFSQFSSNPPISKMSSSVSEEELQGSAIKSLLSLKQGRYSKQKNAFCFDGKDVYDQHPQNPEGSIIKDLLLKTKAKDGQRLLTDKDGQNKAFFNSSSFVSECNFGSNKAGPIQHKCPHCSSEFSDQHNLDKHVSLCKTIKEGPLFSFAKKACSMPVINAQSKSVVSEYRRNSFSSPISRVSAHEEQKSSIDDGPILKKQLLMPLSSSPPVKRRKISEPVLVSNQTIEQQNGIKKDFSKSISNKSNLDGISLSPHRSRSQSVHLFGGEVQILDGIKTKKMKIKTRIQGAFSTSDNYSYHLQKSPDPEQGKYSNSLPAVIVTIAQPVHNSGGTVTHVPTHKHASNIPPSMAFSNSIISEGIIKCPKTEVEYNSNRGETSVIESAQNPLSEVHVKELPSPYVSYSFLPGPESKSLASSSSSTSSFHYSQPSKVKNLKIGSSSNDASPMSFKLALSPDHNNPFYSPIFASSEKSVFDPTTTMTGCLSNHKTIVKNSNVSNHIVPTVLLTPSSPTVLIETDVTSCSSSQLELTKKFLTPTRPTSLPLKKKPFTMVGSTLISPETPRPKKSCVQMYLNGHAYTYLGLKCSTRSTYCCIYRPQPMFVLQETNPKLSMYSNWQVVPAKEELSGLTPGQMISFYNSKQNNEPGHCTTMAKLGEPLTFTHSSYWTYRSQEHDATAECQESGSLAVSSSATDVLVQDSISYVNQTKDICTVSNSIAGHSQRHETVIATTPVNVYESQIHSTDDSSQRLDTDNTLSDDLDANEDEDDDDDDEDCQDDGNDSQTDSSQPQPPKRVKIFEGGFKSNEDYTYVRGRGRGKYVCEECGIRCKKPSMLKKHIRTHTDLRPYKCRHCSFAFKTKGNLTKHMKSKAHHKKCTELGIVPVPTTTDDSQIDEEALAKQIEKKKIQFSDGEDADDDDEDDTDESDDECESDTSMMASNPKPKSVANDSNKRRESDEKSSSEILEDSLQDKYEATSQHMVEQEAARSLLHLSALGEPSQWSTSTGDHTDVASCETDTGSLTSIRHEQYLSPTVSAIALPGRSSKISTDQATLSWIPTETLGHRPRSYSADIPSSASKEHLARYRLSKHTAAEGVGSSSTTEDPEFGSREPYTSRRYSISVAREARKPRIFHPPEWDSGGLLCSKWPDLDSSDQPMDLSISRDLGKDGGLYGHGMPESSLLSIVTQEEVGLDATLPINLDPTISEPYPLKSLPVLSPQIITEYEASGDNTSDTMLLQPAEESVFGNPNRSVFYMPNITGTDASRKETDITEDPPSPDVPDYAVGSPVSSPIMDESSYYYGPEALGQTTSTMEEMPPTSRFHAEFIVPSTSSSMEDGKCVCRICNKIFAKSSHLRLHVNIHYFERPFRCDNCAVSFRTKGHLQKHKRSVSHYNKVNMNLTFGTPTVDNPRPFKCADCKIAFRIHGHLAKHLRSKMHIMKLECLGKLPFGMYAEMERSGVSLNEIDTTDCNNSLESLQVMAQKLYQRDPRRMRWQGTEQIPSEVDRTKSAAATTALGDPALAVTEPLAVTFNLPIVGLPAPATMSKTVSDAEDVKQEPSEMEAFRNASVFSEREGAVSPLSQYLITQPQSAPSQEVIRKNDGPEHDPAISLHRSGTCHICGRLFKSAKFLQVHLYCDHPTWSPSSAGDVTSSNASAVPQHLACDLCGKHFPNQKVLQQHLLSHAQPRPFVCEVCDAGFTSSASLTAHKATHQTSSSTSAASETRLVQLR